MDLETAGDLARDLMDDHGLGAWGFAFDNAKRRCGNCHFGKWRITLSRYYVRMNDEAEVRDTILHEIAHAMAGVDAGHGPIWRKVAQNIGAKPQRCADSSVSMPKPPWRLTCASGHNLGTRHRRSRNMSHYVCRLCRTPLQFVPNT
jgi:predicted SprT family Zn-dependent metalloprotease